MQDAFNRDMFNISDLNNPRYNGHVQVSPCGKSAGGKRDRKGCTKGKIEAIMKNNIVRPKVCVSTGNKKIPSTFGTNHVLFSNHSVVKSEDQEDPYTFTEPEPQVLSLYQAASGSNKKSHLSGNRGVTNMVCSDKSKLEQARVVLKNVKPQDASSASKMNKLQADIARSKVIGKRKKIEQIPIPRGKSLEWNNVNIKRDPNKVCIAAKREARKSTWQRERNSKHELLERIHQMKNNMKQYSRDLYPLGLELSDSDSDDFDVDHSIYERHWFSKSDAISNDSPREKRVEATRAQLRRRLAQTLRGLKFSEDPSTGLLGAVVAAAKRFPNATAAILNPSLAKPSHKTPKGARFLTTGEKCSYSEGCRWQALPSTRHCTQHIMYNVDQRLFHYCTGKGPDNTQCNRPVFDIRHDAPLCPQHAHHQEAVPRAYVDSRHSRKVSKKSRILGLSRNSKRNNKKRKKIISHSSDRPPSVEPLKAIPELSPQVHIEEPIQVEPLLENVIGPPPSLHNEVTDIVEEVPEEVLAIASLDPVELANQATRLLEEHDLNNVLNQISTDAFNDLFTVIADKNGEYEPTREETEELERALEAVDNDVRSLERMTRSLPLLHLPLDSIGLLDEPTPPSFPNFQNGFPPPPPTTTDIHPS